MVKRIRELMQKTNNFYFAVLKFADFYSTVYTASQFGYFSDSALQELQEDWRDFCEFINSYGLIEPLCVEKFQIGDKFNTCCFGDERCMTFEQVLQELLSR